MFELPSSGFVRPALFQSNWAAGTSIDDTALFGSVALAVAVVAALALAIVGCRIFIGSSGLDPKLAANFIADVVHLSPYNCRSKMNNIIIIMVDNRNVTKCTRGYSQYSVGQSPTL